MRPPRKHSALAILFATLVCLLGVLSQAQAIAPVITVDHGPNSPGQLTKPYVILVSLDGLRYDYPRLYHAQNLLAMAARGASAVDGMIPSYPTVTFPNHWSIVTGLYPEHHGIVANQFYDPARKEAYDYRDQESVSDGTWYGGTPLWVVAEQQGMRSASCFWVGSEAEIQGIRPTYYLHYDDSFPNEKRVDQVLAWLRLPPERRPHFITLYFADADHAGHEHGPDSPEVAAAVSELDKEIGRLVAGLQPLNLPVDVIVLADHGMVNVKKDVILLDQFGLKMSSFERVVQTYLYPKSEQDAENAYETLRGKSGKFEVYRRAQMPARFHFDSNPRAGDPIIVATGPYYIRPSQDPQKPLTTQPGNHGFDVARVPEMKALFVAAGPDIHPGSTLPSFESVDVYPLIASILGLDVTHLKTGPIDGQLDAIRSILKSPHKAK